MMYLWRKIFGRELLLKVDPEFDIDEDAAIARLDIEESLTAEEHETRERDDRELREVRTNISFSPLISTSFSPTFY